MAPLLKLIWASYQHNASRVALVLIALITACAGLSAVLVINNTAKNSYASAGQPFLQQVEQRITARSGHVLSKQDFILLRRMGFTQLIPVLRSSQNVIHPKTGKLQRLSLLGVDAFSIFSYSARDTSQVNQNNSATSTQELSQLWTPPFTSVIHPDFASELGFADEQVLSMESEQLLPQLAITNIDGLGREVVMDIGQLQRVLDTQSISELLVIGEKESSATDTLKAALPEHLQLENINTGEQAQQLTDSFHLNLLAMACLMFVVCMFVVMNALHLLIMKRWQNLRIARQLGVSRKQIYWAQGTELVLISLFCAPLGAIAGVFLAQLASPMVSLTLQNLFDVRVGYTQVAYATLVLQCFAACILGAIAAAILPMWQLNTKLALRNLAVSTGSSHSSWLYASILLGCLASGLGYYSTGMLMSFGAIAISIFAGCSLLIYAVPKSLNTLFHYLPERWVLFRWLAADGVRLSQKSKIACCAFFIALTSNIGMNLMVDSFRQATHQWLSQRLVADQYVSTQTPKVFTQWLATQSVNMDLGVNVVERKGIDAFLLSGSQSRVSEQAKIRTDERTDEQTDEQTDNPTKIELRSYPSTELYQAAMLFAEQQTDVWQIFSTGQGVLVNQQLALRHGLTLGETLKFNTEAGLPEAKQIVGIYYDYGNQSAQAMLDLDYFNKYEANTTLFALHFDSEQQQSLFANQLASSSIFNQVSSIPTRELLALSMKTFERTFVITDGLNIVTLLVAALSLATSVVMIDIDNRPQRALLRSMGVGNYHITGLSLIQYTLLSLLACLVALPFGIGLTWLLINLINVQAFSWSYPLLITPSKLFSAGIMSILLIVIVVALPLYKLSRRKLVEDIKCLSF